MELGIIHSLINDLSRSARNAIVTHQRIKDLLEEAQLADQLGLDVFGVREHHRESYALSSPGVVPAAAASMTNY